MTDDIELIPPDPGKEDEGRIRVQRIIPGQGIVSAGEELFINPDTSEEALDDDHQKLL
jgi:hypothetical protein